MAESSTIQQTVDEAYAVDPALCIACDACCQDFPEVFYMGDDNKAHAHEGHPTDKYNARQVIDVCPTAAISFSGEVPPPEDLAQLEEVPGWEAEWSTWRGVEEDLLERDRRYGNDFDVTTHQGYIEVVVRFPKRVPAVRDRFRYGLPSDMPLYRHHVGLEGTKVLVAGWVQDPKVRFLCHTSSSFPAQFVKEFDVADLLGKSDMEFVGYAERFDAHAELRIVLFTDEMTRDCWEWEAHFITDKCTACTICERVCPTNAITGGERFFIDPDLCINCSCCGIYCPFDAITDNRHVTVQKIATRKIPRARVDEDLCTGCEFCVDVCPFEALEMKGLEDDSTYGLPQTSTIAYVIEKNCVSCKLCEQVCIKDAIEVPREHQFQDIGMSFMNYVTDQK